jgi:non-ribosomal peptide synthase protein (TIGR01720 family)
MRPEWIEQIVRGLLEHHDVLRSRFVFDGAEWHAHLEPPGASTPFIRLDFSHLPAAQHKATIEKAVQELQGSLDISTGPLMRVALFSLGPDRPARLLIAVHHAVVDGNTMLLLVEDFLSAYQQLNRGEPMSLRAKTTAYKQVAEWWAIKAKSDEMRREEDDWLSFPWQHTPLPIDFPQGSGNTEASMRGVFTTFSIKETRALLQSVPRLYNVQVMDVLLWGLVEALTQWTGGEWAQIKVVDSGQTWKREMSHFDLSRTVGLFSCDALVMLKRPESTQPVEGLRSIREQIQRIPRHGLGYELLLRNCADPERRRQLQSVFKDEFKLNYHGRLETPFDQGPGFRPARESTATIFDTENPREVLVYCDCGVVRNSLNLYWLYSENFHQRATIAQVAHNFSQALRDLIQTLPASPDENTREKTR